MRKSVDQVPVLARKKTIAPLHCHAGKAYFSEEFVSRARRLFDTGLGVKKAASGMNVKADRNFYVLWERLEREESERMERPKW